LFAIDGIGEAQGFSFGSRHGGDYGAGRGRETKRGRGKPLPYGTDRKDDVEAFGGGPRVRRSRTNGEAAGAGGASPSPTARRGGTPGDWDLHYGVNG
jgi:hypothetical protein